MSEPIFTGGRQFALDGDGYTALCDDILADGRETAIRRYRRSDGRPRYRLTGDVFGCRCGAEFDNLKAAPGLLLPWLAEHAGHDAEAPEAAEDHPTREATP